MSGARSFCLNYLACFIRQVKNNEQVAPGVNYTVLLARRLRHVEMSKLVCLSDLRLQMTAAARLGYNALILRAIVAK